MNSRFHTVYKLAMAAAVLGTSLAAHSSIIVLSGAMDNLQVIAPVYLVPGDDNSPVIGSTNVRLDGTPISHSTATGFASVTFDTVLLTMTTAAYWNGLTGPADRAHVHDAPLGETRLLDPPNNRFFHEVINNDFDYGTNPPTLITSTILGGPVTCTADPSSSIYSDYPQCAPASGSLVDVLDMLTDPRWDPFGPGGTGGTVDDMLAVFMANGLFLDIHTEAYPGGEIRGQLLFHAVPEPDTLALVAIALGAAVCFRRKAEIPHRQFGLS